MRWLLSIALLGVVVALGVPAPRVVAQQPAALVLLSATGDTVAIERFTRTASTIETEVLFNAVGMRLSLRIDLASDATVRRLESAFRPAAADRTGQPQQTATFNFVGDSVIAEIVAGGRAVTQRLGTTRGAIPFINPSFLLVEQVIRRARVIGGDSVSVPAFMIQGGQTIPFVVTRLGADSVIVAIGGLPARLAVDAAGNVLGGVVPAQNLRIVRATGIGDEALRGVKPDYSAPAGAPYTAEEVRVPTEERFLLAGTLTLPRGAKGRVPAFVTITGSGLQDRDEAIPLVKGYGLFRQVADTLARHGVAVLRMDDRGYGASGGNAGTASSADYANDVRAALRYLRGRPEVDTTRLGLIGHSEGGLIAPMVAAQDARLRGIVLMAGPSRTGRRIIEYQNRFAIESASPSASPAQRDSMVARALQSVDSTAATSPWLRFFLGYDPLPAARRVRTPVLILQGETDRQVTADQATELAAALRAGGNRDVTLRVFPRANHLFVEDALGNPSGYARLPSSAVRPDVLATLVTWVTERFR